MPRRAVLPFAVLLVLDPVRWRYEAEVAARVGADSGSVSRVLRRLGADGSVEWEWEPAVEADFGRVEGVTRNRARRRYWRLTSTGAVVLRRLRDEAGV